MYIGMDVHKGQWSICVLKESGEVQARRQLIGPWKQCIRQVASIKGPKSVVFEASCGMGWLYERLTEVCERVVVADPGRLASSYAIKRKNDKMDAEKLAKLLLLGLVPEVYVASAETRAWRALIEYRRRVLALRTAAKCRIRALLRGQGKQGPKRLWSKAGRTWLESLEFQTESDKLRLEMFLADLDGTEESLRRVTRQLDKVSLADERVKLLMTAPGVGVRTAEAVVAYVEEAKRFSNIKCVGSYFGLVPMQDQSGQTNHLGRVTRRGPSVVRWLLVESAWRGIRKSARLGKMYSKILKGQKSRNKIAAVAVAHFLARALVAMLKNRQEWKEAA